MQIADDSDQLSCLYMPALPRGAFPSEQPSCPSETIQQLADGTDQLAAVLLPSVTVLPSSAMPLSSEQIDRPAVVSQPCPTTDDAQQFTHFEPHPDAFQDLQSASRPVHELVQFFEGVVQPSAQHAF